VTDPDVLLRYREQLKKHAHNPQNYPSLKEIIKEQKSLQNLMNQMRGSPLPHNTSSSNNSASSTATLNDLFARMQTSSGTTNRKETAEDCAQCRRKTNSLKLCSACRSVRYRFPVRAVRCQLSLSFPSSLLSSLFICSYCSSDCQRTHWKEGHKARCKEIQQARELERRVPSLIPDSSVPSSISSSSSSASSSSSVNINELD
jgi:hypothetical protein